MNRSGPFIPPWTADRLDDGTAACLLVGGRSVNARGVSTRHRPAARGLAALAIAANAVAANPANAPAAAPIPAGYRLAYEQHFDDGESLKGFAMTDPAAWKFSADGASHALELASQSRYEPAVRSPFNIALVRDRVFGDFILEADLIQTGKEYGHRDMCLFFGVQDATHFYYAHIATKTDDHAHNVFIVNGTPRSKISTATTPGVNWGLEVWHHVRLERRGGEVTVYFDDMTKPIMTANDATLGVGWVGVGSFDDTGKLDNLRIWAPGEVVKKTAEFYRQGR